MAVDFVRSINRSRSSPSAYSQRLSCMLAIVSLALIALPAGAQGFSILNSFTGGSAGLGPEVGGQWIVRAIFTGQRYRGAI